MPWLPHGLLVAPSYSFCGGGKIANIPVPVEARTLSSSLLGLRILVFKLCYPKPHLKTRLGPSIADFVLALFGPWEILGPHVLLFERLFASGAQGRLNRLKLLFKESHATLIRSW